MLSKVFPVQNRVYIILVFPAFTNIILFTIVDPFDFIREINFKEITS